MKGDNIKTWSELGTSPAPWRIADGDDFSEYGYVRDGNDELAASSWARRNVREMQANARAIALLPELHGAALAVEKIIGEAIAERDDKRHHFALCVAQDKLREVLRRFVGEEAK